jgi:glycopeptide antibiotics resistance protein
LFSQSLAFNARRFYLALAVGFIAFAIYISLIPFDFRRTSLAEAWATFELALATWPDRVSRSDALANTLMFCPIGFALMGSLLADRTNRWPLLWSPLVILPISLLSSFAAEFVQTFTIDRMPTRIDIMFQTVGCVIGMAAWVVAGMPLTRWGRATLAASPEDRWTRVLIGYTAAWVFINLAPFDVTFDVGDLGNRVTTGAITIVPFTGGDLPGTRMVWDTLAEILGAIPIGVAAVMGWSPTSRRSLATAFAMGALLIAGVEVAQVFIRSHSASTTDFLVGSAGVAIGAWGGRALLGGTPGPRAADTHLWVPAIAALAAWCLVLAMYHWQPFDFAIDRSRIREKLGDISLIPFAGYARSRWLNAMTDMLTKLSLSLPFGAIASLVVRRRASRVVFLGWIVVAAGVFSVLEFGQLFVPARVPDPTDVLTGVLGTAAGLGIAPWAAIRNRR